MKIVWLRKAQQNLADELDFIHKEAPDVAKRIALLVKTRTESLADFPKKGRIGRISGTYEFVFSEIPYTLPYRINGERIEILRFFHSSRKLPKNW